jgi:hypothetical protein
MYQSTTRNAPEHENLLCSSELFQPFSMPINEDFLAHPHCCSTANSKQGYAGALRHASLLASKL